MSFNGQCLSEIICVQVEADYGIDWNGPHGYDDLGGQVEHIEVPQIHMQQVMTEDNTGSLLDPDVPFMDAVEVYTATQWQLTD